MDLDLQQYMGAYIDGSKENLDLMDRMLLALEQNPGNSSAIEDIFRAAHTLKGMSATMGFEKIAHLTHEMESVLDKLRNRQLSVSPQLIDVLFETFDILRNLVTDSFNQSDSRIDPKAISQKLASIATGEAPLVKQATDAGTSPGIGRASTEPYPPELSDLAYFDLAEIERIKMDEAHQQGLHPYLLKVSLVPDCLLKGPRIFMILRTLETLQCSILKSIPSVKDLENEKFDRAFMMIITTNSAEKAVTDEIESVSEVEKAVMFPIPGAGGFSEEVSFEAFRPEPEPEPEQPHEPEPESPSEQEPEANLEPEPEPIQPVEPARPLPPVAPQPPRQPQPPAPQRERQRQAAAQQPIPAAQSPVQQPPRPSAKPQVQDLFQSPDGPGSLQGGGGNDSNDEDIEAQKEIVELVQLVSFQMAGETYALGIKEVEGIINMLPMTRVPKSPPHIEGVINLRGEILPVINLRRRLKLTEKADIREDQIMILSFEREKVKVGFLVDRVQEVLRLPQTSIEPPSHVSEGVNVEHLRGVGKLGNKIIILLNAEKIVFG
ncbi:chemotaxis protein CheW [Candidatus Ozemobacteraceae bacterium]|nr:chemotaxis protein CheW [Candidatus Ozemobacteraceae bacterium]